MYKLEKYYQGKFEWNGIKIASGSFEHLEHWSQEKGCGDGNESLGSSLTPVFSVYEKVRERVKQQKPNTFSNNRIPANNDVKILIHDLDKPSLIKSTIRYIFNLNPNSKKVYFLKFKDSAQMGEFFEKMHFESVPVIYASNIIVDVKKWLKQNRGTSGEKTTSVRNPQSVRYFTPQCCLNKYGWDSRGWVFDEIDIREEEGLYVDVKNGDALINGISQSNLSYVSHFSNKLFSELGEPNQPVYGILEKSSKSKWFTEAEKVEQWVKLEKYFKDREETFLYGKALKIATAAVYFDQGRDHDLIGVKFSTKILPLLSDKNGVMYKVCSQITQEIDDQRDLVNALKFFDIGQESLKDVDIDFHKLTNNVKEMYPMLFQLRDCDKIVNNVSSLYISDDFAKMASDYINMVDLMAKNTTK
jgi:hypothetical protein